MHAFRVKLAFALVVAALFTACSGDEGTTPMQPAAPDAGKTTAGTNSTMNSQERTPFQRALMEANAERTANGLPVPTVSFQFQSDAGVPLATLQQQGIQPDETVTIVATTVVRYQHPDQAGRSSWPAIVVEGSVPPGQDGFIQEGDYTQAVMDAVEQASPGFWQTYPYGQEPRTYTYTETIVYAYSDISPAAAEPGPNNSTTTGEIVAGFSIPGPGLRYVLEESIEIADVEVGSVKAGFEMDWFFGIRLPMAVSVSGPNSVMEGDSFDPTSIAQGLNWTAADFTNAGLPPESGNEFGMRFNFFLGLEVKVLGASVIQLGPNVDEDASDSFTTPLGPGEVFNLPMIDVPIVDKTVALAFLTIGFTATPQAGSDKFTADWQATGEASGNSSVVHTTSGVSENLGSVLAVDGPGSANLTLDEFEYVFTQFKIALGLFAEVGVDGGIFGSTSVRFDIPVTSFDLSAVVPDLAVGVHDGSSPTSVSGAVSIVNVAPTAEIDLSSATVVNGVPTFLVETGVPYEFKGNSHDPGRDDLTASWDFGDGAPSPDVSTNYPLGAPVGPNDIADLQQHTFDDACLSVATFKVVDDDGAYSEDQAIVISTPPARSNSSRLAGYWQKQFRGVGHTEFDADQLECVLAIISHLSAVFNEERDASTIKKAHDVLFMKGNHGSEQEKMDRELLIAWLNFANGVFGYTEMVHTDDDGVADAPFDDVLAAAESVRLNPGATAEELRAQTQILHNVNTGGVQDADLNLPLAQDSR